VDEGTLQTLIKSGGDSLIVAVKDDPKHAFHLLRPYLRHSRPFVVYCPHIQPLAQLYHELVSAPDRERVAINMQLTESWAREYQVLPSRTHPTMSMSGMSGYMLTGVNICPQGSASAAPQAPAAAAAPAAPESSEGPAAKRAKSE
jgi:tRNA (adenine-N(1)-)-methyltransferase non-catalytic subunit